MTAQSDIEFSARQHIDHLMRRVVMLMFGAGILAVLGIWSMEVGDGTIEQFNRAGYPAMIVVFAGSLFALWRRPQALGPVRWVGFLCVGTVLLADLWVQVASPVALVSNYSAISLLNWLPLCYAIAFFMLEARQAFVAAAAIIAFLAACATLRGHAATAYAAQDRALLINTMIAHAVLVICLSGLLWLKHVVNMQGEQANRLNLLAATDPLTGLANRRQTLRRLDAAAAENRPDLAPVIMLADLDQFKRINDEFGHEVGDQVLVAVSAALRASTRDTDTVARWGGEEFLVLLPRTRAGEAVEFAERLRACVQALAIVDRQQREIKVTMSIGVATLAANESGAAWLHRADEALYRAKEAGRNRCVLADTPVDAAA